MTKLTKLGYTIYIDSMYPCTCAIALYRRSTIAGAALLSSQATRVLVYRYCTVMSPAASARAALSACARPVPVSA